MWVSSSFGPLRWTFAVPACSFHTLSNCWVCSISHRDSLNGYDETCFVMTLPGMHAPGLRSFFYCAPFTYTPRLNEVVGQIQLVLQSSTAIWQSRHAWLSSYPSYQALGSIGINTCCGSLLFPFSLHPPFSILFWVCNCSLTFVLNFLTLILCLLFARWAEEDFTYLSSNVLLRRVTACDWLIADIPVQSSGKFFALLSLSPLPLFYFPLSVCRFPLALLV